MRRWMRFEPINDYLQCQHPLWLLFSGKYVRLICVVMTDAPQLMPVSGHRKSQHNSFVISDNTISSVHVPDIASSYSKRHRWKCQFVLQVYNDFLKLKLIYTLYININFLPRRECGPGSSVGIATELRAGRSGIESRLGRDFPPFQTGPRAHPASCRMGTGSFLGVKCGRGVLLTTHRLLVPRSWNSRAITIPILWATPGLYNGITLPLPFTSLSILSDVIEITMAF